MATLESLDTVKNDLEKAKAQLKDVDENIKRITGRDPTDDWFRRGNDPTNRLKTDTRRPEGTNSVDTDEAMDKQKVVDDDLHVSIASSVVQVAETRKRADASKDLKKSDKERGRRMLGILQGTLNQFRAESLAATSHPQMTKRREIDAKLEANAVEERQRMRRERGELFRSRRMQQIEVNMLQRKMKLIRDFDNWKENILKMKGFCRTSRDPVVYYRPLIHNKESKRRLADTARAIDADRPARSGEEALAEQKRGRQRRRRRRMSADQGDVSTAPVVGAGAASASSRAALMTRLAERQAGARTAVQQRRQRHEQHLPGGGGLANEFLGNFLRIKASILGELEAGQTALLAQQQPAKMHQVTELIDKILLRIEALQKMLNDCAPYLTHFDIEQARTELKTLNSEFQTNREQLLPTKKFSFSRTPAKPISTTNPPSHQPPRDNKSPSKAAAAAAAAENPADWFDERFSLVGLQNESLELPRTAVTSSSETTLDKSVYLADLVNCRVQVTCVSGNLVARRLRNCLVSVRPVAGSVWLEDCTDCTLLFACRQLRVHATHGCRLGLHTASRPIIEACSDLLVGPYPLDQFDDDEEQQVAERDMPLAGLRRDVNLWSEVEDFSHPNKRLTTGSPNWSVMPREQWASLCWTKEG